MLKNDKVVLKGFNLLLYHEAMAIRQVTQINFLEDLICVIKNNLVTRKTWEVLEFSKETLKTSQEYLINNPQTS